MKRTLDAALFDHPASVGETYLEHLRFAAGFGLMLIGAGLAAMVHGILPCAFEKTASNVVKELYPRVANRGDGQGS